MSQYARWEDLERLLESDQRAYEALMLKHTELMTKWTVLRKRMGKHCVMARGVLKVIVLYEANNKAFIKSTQSGEWQE